MPENDDRNRGQIKSFENEGLDFHSVPSQTLDRQTLDTTNPGQANTRHNKP